MNAVVEIGNDNWLVTWQEPYLETLHDLSYRAVGKRCFGASTTMEGFDDFPSLATPRTPHFYNVWWLVLRPSALSPNPAADHEKLSTDAE